EEYKITSSIIEKTTNRTYTITLEPNGGKLENTTYEVTQNRQYGVLPTPVREGYIFLGWYLGTQKIEGDYLVTESGEHTLTAEWTNNLDFPFSMGDGVFYFLKGSSCDFTEIIESLGKSVDDFSSNNFKAVIADQTLSTSINKPATGGQSTGTNATSSLSISYNKNTGNCSVTTSNASGKSAYTTINTWTTPNNDGVYQHNKTNYYSTSTAISKIIVFGIIFDPSDEPFSH
ncbi:MAG: InlB B-repeat-containing protein, partial [Erysipelotrichales bacterium]|nr:InlB B-repeat-containing protein [Erysipelotrichales bacterium]